MYSTEIHYFNHSIQSIWYKTLYYIYVL